MTSRCGEGDGGAGRRGQQTSKYPSEDNSNRMIPKKRFSGPVIMYLQRPETLHVVEAHNFKEMVQLLTGKEVNQDVDSVDKEAVTDHNQQSNSPHTLAGYLDRLDTEYPASPTHTTLGQSSFISGQHSLEEYLDRLDTENPSSPMYTTPGQSAIISANHALEEYFDRLDRENPSSHMYKPPRESSFISSHHALEEYLDKLDRENPPPAPSANLGLFPTAGLVKGVNPELGLQWRSDPDSLGLLSSGVSSDPSEPSS